MKYLTVFVAAMVLLSMAPSQADEIALQGVLRPWRTIVLRSAADGIIDEVHCERGDIVKKGDIVATLEFKVERANLEIARAKAEGKADLAWAQADLSYKKILAARSRELFQKGVTNKEQLDDVENSERLAAIRVNQEEEALFRADLEYQRSQASYALREIKAPIGGVVVERLRSGGEMVTRSVDSPIVRIAQMNPLAVDVIAPVALFSTIHAGMETIVIAESLNGRHIKAKVKTVDRVADAASGTFGFRIEIENPKNELPAGLKCRVLIPQK